MGDGVFGIPVTNATLEGLPEYDGITNLKPIDRARVALRLKNSDEKNARALRYLEDLKETSGDNAGTLCLLYNATGDTLKYALRHDWEGHIGASPYPIQIANGQWGAFLHIRASRSTNSVGAVVYHGKDAEAADCDWFLAWNKASPTTVFNEVRDKDHFTINRWNLLLGRMQQADVYYSDDNNPDQRTGTSSSASIGNHSFPIVTAIFTLQGL